MKRFPHTNAQFVAVLVCAVGVLGALIVLQRSSLSNYLKAVPVTPDGACYIGGLFGEDDPRASCTKTMTAKECEDQARGKPYLFIPGRVCPRPDSANQCEKAGEELVQGLGFAEAQTREESEKLAVEDCRDSLIDARKLVCPVG